MTMRAKVATIASLFATGNDLVAKFEGVRVEALLCPESGTWGKSSPWSSSSRRNLVADIVNCFYCGVAGEV